MLKKLFSVNVGAEAIGVSTPTMRRYIQEELVPVVRVGGRVLVTEDTIAKIQQYGLTLPASAKAGKRGRRARAS
jgi:hypothetical protein